MACLLDPVSSYLVGRVGESVTKEVKFLRAVKEEVEDMQIELQWMKSFLEDADLQVQAHSQQHQSRVFRRWVSQINEASLDAEDVVNTYLVILELKKRGGVVNRIKRFSCIIKKWIDIHKMGLEIEDIKSKLATLRLRLQTYGAIRDLRLGDPSSSSFGGQAQLGQRRTYGHIVDRNVVGLDGKTDEVVGLLLGEEEACRVVSIYGMGGLGKTTLAKKVYHNDKIRRSFDKFAWVPISQQFNARDVWKTIYIELTSSLGERQEEIKAFSELEIVSELDKVLKEQKCFLVLDDIWSIEAWDKLSQAFPTATTSKILLTTRIKDLAEHVDQKGSYGELRHLTPEQSWELLQKIAFSGRKDIEDKKSKENLGKEMIKHCGGLPLAIVVLAGTLATKETVREWEIVGNNIRAYLRKGKGGSEEQCLGVNGVLSSSYYDLPHQLKSCFLYLSQFSEDHEIKTSRLLKMWMAEGFVSTQNDRDGEELVEDLAERYLNELVGRCMVQVGEKGSTGRIKTCRMHDLMLDMCLSKAKEENFIQSFIGGTGTNIVGSVRRLSIFYNESDNILQCRRNSKLRSFILYFDAPNLGCTFSPKFEGLTLGQTITNFKLLRMLVLESIEIKEKKFSKEIGNLIHVKYLSLRGSVVSYFPSMKKLGCLETLDLRVSLSSGKGRVFGGGLNTKAIWKMKNLRHLYLPHDDDCYSSRRSKKVEIGMNMESVQTLVNFPPPNYSLTQLVNFSNLRKLQIRKRPNNSEEELSQIFGRNNNHRKAEFSRLSSLSIVFGENTDKFFSKIDIEGILIGCPNVYKLKIEGRLVNFPPEVNQLLGTKLTKLQLRKSEISDPKYIETNLGKLLNLKILHLQFEAFKGRELCFQRGSFPQLKSLHLEFFANLEEWRVDEGAMPILQSLRIFGCPKLKMVPEGLRFISTLKELDIWTRLDFRERVKEGGPDFHKVQHIPTINI